MCVFVIDGLTDRMTDRQVVRQIQKDKPIYGWMKGQTDIHEETNRYGGMEREREREADSQIDKQTKTDG